MNNFDSTPTSAVVTTSNVNSALTLVDNAFRNVLPVSQNNSITGKFSSLYVNQNIPLSAQVSEKLKLEIWSGAYVDLTCIQTEEK